MKLKFEASKEGTSELKVVTQTRRLTISDTKLVEEVHNLDEALMDYPVDIRESVKHNINKIIVALTKDEKLQGYIVYQTDGNEAHVLAVGVKERYRKQGVANTLLDQVMPKHRTTVLTAREDNFSALQLYYKLGFKVQRKLPDLYGEGENGLFLGYYEKPEKEA